MGTLRLIVAVLVETILGLMVAAGILAVVIPVLLRRGLIAAGDAPGSAVVGLVMISCVVLAVLRPDSALRRRGKH
jgi:hypothetical protein